MKRKKELEKVVPAENGTETKSKSKKKHKVLSTVINVVLIIAIILAALCTYVSFVSSSGSGVPSILGIRPFSVQTDSMWPTLNPGDLIIDKAVKDTSTLQVGDIITYWTVINGERVLNTHRIVEIYDLGTSRAFATKGDKNDTSDPMEVHESYIVGKYSFKIDGLGKVFDYLQTSTGFLIVVVVPVLLFFIYHLVQFFRVLFEYQNVKNRLKYEQERGRTEELIEDERRRDAEKEEKSRAEIEAELREKLKAELMADLAKEQAGAASEAVETPAVTEEPVSTEEPAAEESETPSETE